MNEKYDPQFREPDDSQWEAFFEQRPLASEAFAWRVVAAVRQDRRRRRVARSGWGAIAATIMVSFILWTGVLPDGSSGGAYASEITPEEAAVYGELLEWEEMLAEAEGLFEEEHQETLEILLAVNEGPLQ